MRILQSVLLSIGLALTPALATPGLAATVDLELMLMTDASGSVDSTDYNLYIQGYAAAFRSASLIQAITEGPIGKIAVAVGFFSDGSALGTAWTIIEDAASGEAFAQVIEGMSRPFSGGTGIAQGINFAAAQFASNGIDGSRQVIDVVGDGSESNCGNAAICLSLQNARDAALEDGVDGINALLIQDRFYFGENPGDYVAAIDYGKTNIIGGEGSFVSFIDAFEEFPTAIAAKLQREIKPEEPNPSPVPLPAAGWVLLAGLGSLAAASRKRRLG